MLFLVLLLSLPELRQTWRTHGWTAMCTEWQLRAHLGAVGTDFHVDDAGTITGTNFIMDLGFTAKVVKRGWTAVVEVVYDGDKTPTVVPYMPYRYLVLG